MFAMLCEQPGRCNVLVDEWTDRSCLLGTAAAAASVRVLARRKLRLRAARSSNREVVVKNAKRGELSKQQVGGPKATNTREESVETEAMDSRRGPLTSLARPQCLLSRGGFPKQNVAV